MKHQIPSILTFYRTRGYEYAQPVHFRKGGMGLKHTPDKGIALKNTLAPAGDRRSS